MARIAEFPLREAIFRAGGLQLLKIGEPKQAAITIYEWMLKESIPKKAREKSEAATANLYDMLSYLLEHANTLGFDFDSRIEQGKMVFVIRSKINDSKVVPILMELLFAHIFEKLGNLESEITHHERDTVVKIHLR